MNIHGWDWDELLAGKQFKWWPQRIFFIWCSWKSLLNEIKMQSMEAEDWLRQPLKGTAKERKNIAKAEGWVRREHPCEKHPAQNEFQSIDKVRSGWSFKSSKENKVYAQI